MYKYLIPSRLFFPSPTFLLLSIPFPLHMPASFHASHLQCGPLVIVCRPPPQIVRCVCYTEPTIITDVISIARSSRCPLLGLAKLPGSRARRSRRVYVVSKCFVRRWSKVVVASGVSGLSVELACLLLTQYRRVQPIFRGCCCIVITTANCVIVVPDDHPGQYV